MNSRSPFPKVTDSLLDMLVISPLIVKQYKILASCSAPACALNFHKAKWETFLDALSASQFSQSSPLLRQFSAVTTLSDRLSLFLANSKVSHILMSNFTDCKRLLSTCPCHGKDARKADDLRLVANKSYSAKCYNYAYRFYTSALMRAPEDSEEAALLYGNRSAAYFHVEQYENALEDIERALKLDYARLKPTGTGKLFTRKAKCLLALGRGEEAKAMFDESSELQPLNEPGWSELTDQNTSVEARDVNLFKFHDFSAVSQVLIAKNKFTPHETFPWLNGKIDLRYDAENGYQLFAKEHLAYGEIAAIGEPSVSWALASPVPGSPHQCENCLIDIGQSEGNSLGMHPEFIEPCRKLQGFTSGPSRCFAPVPCTVCPNVLFCSEACRSEAWQSYHRFECSQVLILNSVNHQARLALRMLYSAGSVERIKQVAHETENSSDRFEMMKNPSDYAFVYSMRQEDVAEPKEAFRLIATAVVLTKLAQLSGFLGNVREDELMVMRTLLSHMRQVKANVAIPTDETPMGKPVHKPTRLHGIATLMGSSNRQANIARFWIGQRSTIQSNVHLFYVTKPIKAGKKLLLLAGDSRLEDAEEDLQFDFLLTSEAN